VVGAAENKSLSCVRKPSLEAPMSKEPEDPDRFEWFEVLDARDANDAVESVVRIGCDACVPPRNTVFGGVGMRGGNCFDTENDRIVSTPPLFRARDTKHVKLSTKYFRSFFMLLRSTQTNPSIPKPKPQTTISASDVHLSRTTW
jgi:hypothetical protein